MAAPADFDRLARVYRALEFLAFGAALERARFCFLDRLADCHDILVLGEGDGRCLERLAALAPQARIHCVDASSAMLARAAARAAPANVNRRLTFEKADVRAASLAPGRYDAVVTFFFLDCFRAETVAELVARVDSSLRPGALWLFADFVLPPRSWTRWRARLWLAVLYAFFRWETGIQAPSLPPSEAILGQAGFRCVAVRDFQRGLVRSAVFKK
jgi:cyclopropane fatty-acyl-phospholipid synthase-like methyltransferase